MIDLIVVAYQSPRDLTRFVESIATQELEEPLNLTVVEVDPAPRSYWAPEDLPQGVEPMLKNLNQVIHLENVGYNVACNAAGADMDSDVIICCNADVAFTADSPDCLERLAFGLRANAFWGIVGPRQVNRQHRITAAGIFGPLDAPKHRGWHDRDPSQYDDIRADAAIVSGSVFALRRDTWRRLTECPTFQEVAPDSPGPFLPTKHFWGETYACAHAYGHGYNRVYYGPVWCYHEVAGAPRSGSWANMNKGADRAYFASACEAHDLPHDQKGRTRA